jgi:hypothetical protein
VVPYWSSHLDAARSEKIVPYPHTAMFVKPEATDEIKRILRCTRPLLEMLLDAQSRAEARVYARLPLSRLELSALADGERSPAIHRRVSVENGSVVASRRLNRKASHRIR